MCGIAGFVDFKHTSSEDVLESITKALVHRGPDGDGTSFFNNDIAQVGLGHRRLSIIDLSDCGRQPMTFNGLHITYNGEIYNYQEVREQLEKKGHQFVSHTDTEVILHSIQEWGLNAVEKWHGMFALVIYDEQNQQLFALRDRAGVKPFNYHWNNDIFIFGSELKAITAHPSFVKKINTSSVASFFQYGYIPYPHSIWEDTYKLSPGHLLKLDFKTKQVTTEQYWNVYDYYNRPKLKISFADALIETEKILEKGFQYRMVADVPVGVFLSGGFDSSCVTALLQKNSTEKIKTFTIGTTDESLNEAPFAKEIARHLGTDHTEYYCTPKEALDIIPELPYYYDEPFADSSAIPTMLVSRLAREKVTVALSADAGDEIFAGYWRYEYLMKYGGRLNKIPQAARKLMAETMDLVPAQQIPILNKKKGFNNKYQKLQNLLRDPSAENMMLNLTQLFNDKELSQLIKHQYTPHHTAHFSTELNQQYFDPLSYMLAVDYQTYMNDDILQKVDRATMSISLEGREPFLDQSIIEWAAQLPNAYKYKNGEKKFILKKIVYKYIPKEMMDRKKMGFSIPVDKWLSVELKDLVISYLSEKSLNKHGLFNSQYVTKLMGEFLRGKQELHTKIWYLLMFQMWHARWVD